MVYLFWQNNNEDDSNYWLKSHLQEIFILSDACFLPALDFALHFPQFVSQTRKLLVAIVWPELVGPMCDKVIQI